MTDFDAVFFIRLQKTTKVTLATKILDKNGKRGHFLRKKYVFLTYGYFYDVRGKNTKKGHPSRGRHRTNQKYENIMSLLACIYVRACVWTHVLPSGFTGRRFSCCR